MEIRHIYYKTEDAAYTISYVLTRKQVKYINLRIKSNGEVAVSAHRRVPAAYVDKFVESKAPFILEALERVEKRREETGDRPTIMKPGKYSACWGAIIPWWWRKPVQRRKCFP